MIFIINWSSYFVTFFSFLTYKLKMYNMKSKIKVELTELFMAKADWQRCFFGTIKRDTDENSIPVLSSKIRVKNDSFDETIYARVSDSQKSGEELQDQLGEQLDEMVMMILDCGLTKMPAKTEVIEDTKFFLN